MVRHHQPNEKLRIEQILKLIPGNQDTILEIGARDGYLSPLLTNFARHVTALDLTIPRIEHEKITPIQGDVTNLQFENNYFDTVVCTEVLEHIRPSDLSKACQELTRVTKHHLIIGVPYNQDTRLGRTTCQNCGHKNPPWGHVNIFNKERLIKLFPALKPVNIILVAQNRLRTNRISTLLFDYAGNPWGTYTQEEPCVNCGNTLLPPENRNFTQKVATRVGHYINNVQRFCSQPKPTWIHVLFEKR